MLLKLNGKLQLKCISLKWICASRFARISTKRNGRSTDTSGKIGLHVSRLQYDLYDCTEFGNGEIHEKTICQIYKPFYKLRNISMYVPINCICVYGCVTNFSINHSILSMMLLGFSAAWSCITAHRIFGIGIYWYSMVAWYFGRLEKAWAWRDTGTNWILYHCFHHK